MINYNDGKWHRHCGSAMPDGVHPKSIVKVRMLNPGSGFDCGSDYARKWRWDDYGGDTIIAFCVIKEHKEPREFWIDAIDMTATQNPCHASSLFIKVREVLE